jgi:short-subunit dehydrogenase
VLSVNLYGQIHGVRAFVPRMQAHGQGGHVVNTASMAGLAPRLDTRLGIYSASKAASVAFSDTLREELAGECIGVSTLCPGPVQSRIWEAARNRPAHLGPGQMIPTPERAAHAPDPMLVGEQVVRGIRENRAFIYISDDTALRIEQRVARLLSDLDR